MDMQEALVLIGAQEIDTWEDDLMNQVFEIKQFILKTYHSPQVCWARSKKLDRLAEAQAFLLDKPFHRFPQPIPSSFLHKNNTFGDIIAAYRQFENLISTIKLHFLQAQEVAEAAKYLLELGNLEHKKLIDLSELAEQLEVENTEIKISTFVNSGEIIRELIPFVDESISKERIKQLPIFSTELAKSLNYINFTKK